jgi:hypothetical protein
MKQVVEVGMVDQHLPRIGGAQMGSKVEQPEIKVRRLRFGDLESMGRLTQYLALEAVHYL